MERPPNKADFRAAIDRRIHNIARSLESIARLGWGDMDLDTLAAVWRAQHLLFAVQPPVEAPDDLESLWGHGDEPQD